MALHTRWISNSYPMDEHVNNIIIAANAIIQYKVDTVTLSNTNANILREALIRIRNVTKFLNSIIKFNECYIASNVIMLMILALILQIVSVAS